MSVGDTIDWGTYPTTLDGSGPRGTFEGLEDTVVDFNVNQFGVIVNTANGAVMWIEVPGTEQFNTISNPNGLEAQLNDEFVVGFNDAIVVTTNLSGPGQPDTLVPYTQIGQEGSQGFLDIWFA